MLASFPAYGIEPISQILVISWCSLLNRLSPPCFHTTKGMPSECHQSAGIFVCCRGRSSAPGLQHSGGLGLFCSQESLGSNQSWCFLSGLPRYVFSVSIGSVYIGQYPEKCSLSQVFSALILAWPVDVCSLSQVFSALILAWPVDVCSLSQVFSALILAWPVDACSLSQVSSPLNLAWPVDVRSCRNC